MDKVREFPTPWRAKTAPEGPYIEAADGTIPFDYSGVWPDMSRAMQMRVVRRIVAAVNAAEALDGE